MFFGISVRFRQARLPKPHAGVAEREASNDGFAAAAITQGGQVATVLLLLPSSLG